MSEINKGILFFKEWMVSLEQLPPKAFKAMIIAMCEYQFNDVPPPEFTGKSAIVASIIFPCLQRRKEAAAKGHKGAEARYGSANAPVETTPTEQPSKSARATAKQPSSSLSATDSANSAATGSANSSANSTANGTANGTANSSAIGNRIEEYSKEKKSKEEYSIEERNIGKNACEAFSATEERAKASDALAQENKQEDFLKKRYGYYGNVLLTDEEYDRIRSTIPNADEYVDKFSRKLHDKGYRYDNHAEAILNWWKKDSSLPSNNQQAAPRDESFGSFDTDEFFQLAVRKSLGNGAF